MRDFLVQNPLIIAIILWTLPWKATALWKSARRKEIGWFIALLLINTAGILEILYIFIFSEREKKGSKVRGSTVRKDG